MAHFGSRIRTVVAASTAVLVLAAALAGPVAAGKPATGFTSVITTDGACSFTLQASWPGTAKVGTVYAMWYLDDAFLFTTQAPGTGPNGGTVKGHVATMTVGPLDATTSTHTFRAITQFYSAAGAQLSSIDSNTVSSICGVTPAP
jgi:hypothetical protein